MTEDRQAPPAPEALRVERTRDLVFDKATLLGFQAMCAEGDALTSLAGFRAGLRLALDYYLSYDRRGK